MATATIIDALFCLPKNTKVLRIADCVPFNQDLSPLMKAGGSPERCLRRVCAERASTSGTAPIGGRRKF